MDVLVTGACGFLGSHISEYFKKQGWNVLGLDNLTMFEFSRSGYNEEARYYNYLYLTKRDIKILIRDFRKWDDLKDIKVDYIIHTGAQPTITLSKLYPRYDLEVNILGTLNLLELARILDIPITICSTIHVYGNRINQELIELETSFDSTLKCISEKHSVLQGDITPLHVSKYSSELYGLCYIDTYHLKVGIFRLTGIYGPRQFPSKYHGWVSYFIVKTLLKKPIYIFGTDKQVRDILYVKDASAVFLNYFKYQLEGLYNIGGGLECKISLKETLDIIKELTNINQDIIFRPTRHGDLWYFVCDITKVSKYLNWKPNILPKEGLKRTVKWFISNLHLFEGIL